MPQKGFKKDDGVRGRREKISSKFFPFFPDLKSTFIGNRALYFLLLESRIVMVSPSAILITFPVISAENNDSVKNKKNKSIDFIFRGFHKEYT